MFVLHNHRIGFMRLIVSLKFHCIYQTPRSQAEQYAKKVLIIKGF